MATDKKMTQDQERRLVLLEAYVVETTGKSPNEFWQGFHTLSEDLDQEAFSDDADAVLLERYTALLANADEAGFMVPDEAMEEPKPRLVHGP